MPILESLPIIISGLIIIYIILEIFKLFFVNYKYISKSYAVSEYKKSTKFFDNSIRNRFAKTSIPLDGDRTTFKDSKSKSLMRYDLIRINSILKRI